MTVARRKRQAKPQGRSKPDGRLHPPKSAPAARPAKSARVRTPKHLKQARGTPLSPPVAPKSVPPQSALGASTIPMGLLMNVLRGVFLERFALTRKGWRPREAQAANGGIPADDEPGGRPGMMALVDEVMTLHSAYTSHDGEFFGGQNPIHHQAGGYQLYYLPRNLYRVLSVLQRLPWKEQGAAARVESWLSGRDRFRLLDLGCGSGAFSLAILAWVAQSGADPRKLPPGEIVLVDQSRPLLDLAEANVRRFAELALPGWTFRLELRPEGVGRFLDREAPSTFALVGAAMMLNELGLVGSRHRARAPRIVRQIGLQAAPGGLLLFVEPGTRQGYLNLMPVRDQRREFPILYPCPHQLACPMFDGAARRWCHATVLLPPRFFFDEALQRQGGLPLHMRELNLSALVMQANSGGELTAPFAARSGNRVVSSLLPGRAPLEGQPVLLLCTPKGRLEERPIRETGPAGRGEWVSGSRFG
jgi:SAM-dependent methyltransferase